MTDSPYLANCPVANVGRVVRYRRPSVFSRRETPSGTNSLRAQRVG